MKNPKDIPEFFGIARSLDDPERVLRVLFRGPVSDEAKTKLELLIADAVAKQNEL